MAVLVGVMCAVLVSVEGIRRLSFDADILALLPQNGRVTPAFREFLSRFGTLDQLYILFTSPDGYAIADYQEEIDAWVEQLRQAPEIAGVDAGVADRSRDFGWLAGRQLLLLQEDKLDEALRRLEPAGLTRAVAGSRELLTVPSSEVAELVRQDPAGLLTLVLPTFGGTDTGLGGDSALSGYVTADGRSRVVIARPRRPPFDSAFSRALDDRLRRVASAVRTATAAAEDPDEPRPPMRVEFAGGHRIALETEALVRRESIVNTVGSLAVILPLLFVVFRSIWLVLVGAVPATISLDPRPGRARLPRCSLVGGRNGRVRHALRSRHRWRGPPVCRASAPAYGDGHRRDRVTDLRARGEHAPRHVDDGGDVLRFDVR